MTLTPQPNPPSLGSVAGSSHQKLIEDALAEERVSKASLEQRSLAVITTSGVVATLLFGLAAFAKQSEKVALGTPEIQLIIGALAAFLLAAATALWIIRPRPYDEAGIKYLRQ
ncbi:MAG: hypothetical protein ACREN2_12125 [Candidatus Dormibacteria bacterium]